MNESTYDPTTGKYSQRAVSENAVVVAGPFHVAHDTPDLDAGVPVGHTTQAGDLIVNVVVVGTLFDSFVGLESSDAEDDYYDLSVPALGGANVMWENAPDILWSATGGGGAGSQAVRVVTGSALVFKGAAAVGDLDVYIVYVRPA